MFFHLRAERFRRSFRLDQHLVPRVSLKAFFSGESDVQPLGAVRTDPLFGFKYKLGELSKAECVVTVCTFPSYSERPKCEALQLSVAAEELLMGALRLTGGK